MKKTSQVLILTVLLIMLDSYLFAQDFIIDGELTDGNQVKVSFTVPEPLRVQKVELYRSSTNLANIQIDMYGDPITKFTISPDGINDSFTDESVAHNTTYYYLAKIEAESKLPIFSNVVSVSIPNVSLGPLARPNFLIHKLHYYLEIRDSEQPKKRYPIALGQDPIRRKLHQDNASTPEGIYRIVNLQPKATFYKAYDLNYPNRIDRIRYNFAKREDLISSREEAVPAIGGEIQIHGMGIGANWTWGCVALRNEDMDELFSHSEIRSGTTVVIVGQEIRKEDLVSILAK